jgi:uncharacterized protein YacL (UPF0231 family)
VFNGPSGSSATLIDEGGKRHDGDLAEEEIHRILGVEQLAAKGKRGFLTQWSHLWVWQGSANDDPTSTDVLNAAAGTLRKRLTSIVGGGLAESERDSATFSRVVAAHDATFTEKGLPRRGSELDAAREHRDKAAAAATAAAAQLRVLELAADAIIREDESQRSHQATLQITEVDLADSTRKLAEVNSLERTLEQQEAEAAAAADAYKALADGDAEILQAENDLAALRDKLADSPFDLLCKEVLRLVRDSGKRGQ